jgi:hypothetical protein
MKKEILLSTIFISLLNISGNVFSQTNEDVTLVFKRPFNGILGDGFYSTKITVNGKEACIMNSDAAKIETCTYKTNAGETKIVVSTSRGTDFENIFDAINGKNYTLVVYMKNHQMYDMIWEEISNKIIVNKAKEKESNMINAFSYKALVISIK